MTYLFAAAAVVWIGTLVTFLYLLRKQARLRLEMMDLKRQLEEWSGRSRLD